MSADQTSLDLGGTVPDPALRSRRAILTAAAGAVGAVLATLARPLQVDAGAGDPVRIGRANKGAGTNTTLTTRTDAGAALRIVQNGAGAGVRGTSIDGTGVSGQSENWVGLGGISENGFAIWGQSTNNYAGFFVNHVFMGGWIDIEAISPPGASGENQARLYVWDDMGKTTLSVSFPDGSSVDLAAET